MLEKVTEPEKTEPTSGVHRPEIQVDVERHAGAETFPGSKEAVFQLESVGVDYGGAKAVMDVTMDVYRNNITALIGPSGCGKSTLIRTFNRMNDLIPSANVHGKVLYHGQDLYGDEIDPVEVRKRIGMVFQKPNPFPKSIYDNIAFGPRDPRDGGRAWTRSSRTRSAAPRSGRRSRTASTTTPSACRAASSSACASRAASP